MLDITTQSRHGPRIAQLVAPLSYWHTEVASAVPQTTEGVTFEETSELGVSKAVGPPAGAALLGFRLRDLDTRSAFGWRYLRDANATQARAVMDSIIHADRKVVAGLILHRLFTLTRSRNEFNHACYGLHRITSGRASRLSTATT